MKRRIITMACVLAVAAAAALSAQQAPTSAAQPAGAPEFNKLLAQIDMHLNFDTDFSAAFSMVDIDPAQGTNVFRMLMFRRDPQDKFVMLFLQPEIPILVIPKNGPFLIASTGNVINRTRIFDS